MIDRHKYLSNLRKTIVERFNEGELQTLCFDLGLDYDDLPGVAKSDKARELVEYLDRRGLLNKLLQLVKELRPRVDWDHISGLQNDILPALSTSGLKSTEIKFSVCEGDIANFGADVIALKFAQGFFGADNSVAIMLDVGKDIVDTMHAIGDYKIFHSLGKVKSPHVFFMSVFPLYGFGYREIRKFSFDILTTLADKMPSVQHLAMTVHGVGYGLDETESLQSQLAGCLDAFDVRSFPSSLQRITIVEQNPSRAQRLDSILNNAIPDGIVVIPAVTTSHLSYIKRSSLTKNVGEESAAKPHVLVLASAFKESEDVYYYGIQTPINDAGYLCERVNLVDVARPDFLDHIRSRIETSSFVLADLTLPNPNLYLLLGYAWGKERPIIIALQNSGDLQFETKEHQYIIYKQIRDLEQALRVRLAR